MTKTKKQHYLPQFLLRNFAVGKKLKAKLWVLDKRSASVFPASVNDVAHENMFYEYKGEGGRYNFEHVMEKLDSKAAAIIRHVIETSKLPRTGEDFVWLSYCVVAQMLRTPVTRKDIDNFRELIIHKWGKEVAFEDDPKNVGEYGPEDSKVSSIRLLRDVPYFARLLQEKVWVLSEAPAENSYVIGDNPVSRHNMIDRGPRGNLGLKNDGIELYTPLSPKLTLHMICPKIATATLHTPELAKVYLYALINNKPIRMKPENIDFMNSLQVIWAERFVYARNRDHLEMPLDMLRTNPELKDGPGVRQRQEDV
jgi:hypothetical protein